jgi:hypothetical protein
MGILRLGVVARGWRRSPNYEDELRGEFLALHVQINSSLESYVGSETHV